MNPSLKQAFQQGDWHDALCDELLAAAWQKPSVENLVVALDALHCVRGVDSAVIDRMDACMEGRLITYWPLVYRLCSLDIAQRRSQSLEARLERSALVKHHFIQHRALTKFPRVLHHLASTPDLPTKLKPDAKQAKQLLQQTQSIQSRLAKQSEQPQAFRVALVGNGPSMQGSNQGVSIDAHDVVIRFNHTGVNNTYDTDLGKKTDLWVMSPNSLPTTSAAIACDCAITGPDPWTRPSHYWKKAAMHLQTTLTFDIQRWHALVKHLSAPPSAGLLMLDALRVAGVAPNAIAVHGFDRLSGLTSDANAANHYRDKQAASSRHNWSAEAELFQQWMSEKNLTG